MKPIAPDTNHSSSTLPRSVMILAVAKRVLRSLRHDPRSIALMLIAPCLAMFVFGFAMSGEVEDVHLIVVDDDTGMVIQGTTLQGNGDPGNVTAGNITNITLDLSNVIRGNLDRNTLDIEQGSSLELAIREVENGNAWGVIYFPPDFTERWLATMNSLRSNNGTNATTTTTTNTTTTANTARPMINSTGTPELSLFLDRSNTNVAEAIQRAVQEALMRALEEQGFSGAEIKLDPVYGGDADFIDMFIPGIMAFTGFMLTLILTLLSFVGERQSGTLERLKVSPLTETELVLGYAISYGIMGMVQSAVLLMVATLYFQITIEGSILLAFLVVMLLAMATQALGILLSSAAKTEAQAVQFFPLIVLPTFLLAGIFWPVEALPTWLRPFSYLIPPTYAVSALRSIFLRGWGLDMIWKDVMAIIVFLGVFLAGAIVRLKRE
jgi:ABC-2 type transport system permease protein